MLLPDKWFPQKGSQNVVGRVVELKKVHAARSREEQREVIILVPAMEHKVLKDSADVSHTELKPHNREMVCQNYPGAWEYYQKQKEAADEAPLAEKVLPTVEGMSIDRADWIPKNKLEWMKHQGFSTIEQLAAMSDEQVSSMGPGVRNWRKKAKELLQKG